MERLKKNLLSISQLCDKGNKVIFTVIGVKVKRMDTKKIVLTARRYKNVYKADIMEIPRTEMTCLSAIENDPLL